MVEISQSKYSFSPDFSLTFGKLMTITIPIAMKTKMFLFVHDADAVVGELNLSITISSKGSINLRVYSKSAKFRGCSLTIFKLFMLSPLIFY